MDTCKKTQIRKYIEKVIDDACKSENRQNDVTFDAFIIDSTDILVILHCKYMRVTRRVRYRLERNILRNFGLHLVDINCEWDIPGQRRFYADTPYLSAGYTVADIVVGNVHYFIRPFAFGAKSNLIVRQLTGSTDDPYPWELRQEFKVKMEAVGGHIFYYPKNKDGVFEQYKSDFRRAFGEEIKEVPVERI